MAAKTLTLATSVTKEINRRVTERNLNAFRISIALGGKPTPETVGNLLKGKGIKSVYLFRILELLGWTGELEWKETP